MKLNINSLYHLVNITCLENNGIASYFNCIFAFKSEGIPHYGEFKRVENGKEVVI